MSARLMYQVNRQARAYTYVAIVVLLWSTVASAFKISLRYLDFTQLVFYATLVSILAFFIIMVIQRKLSLLAECTTKDCARSALLGFLNPFLYYLVLFKAYSLLPAQQAISLNYTWAIQLVILSIPLLRQRIGLKSIVAIIISYFGVVTIATRGDIAGFSVSNATGIFFALGSAFIWALFWIFNIKDRREEIIKLFLNFCFGFFFIIIYSLLFDRMIIPSVAGMLGAGYVGLFEMGITFILWLKALRLSRTTAQVTNLVYLTPFLALVLISVVIGERILFSTIIGLLFIVSGIVLQKYSTHH